MKKALLALLLTYPLTVAAREMQIKISNEQIQKLDIQVNSLIRDNQIPVLYAPAKIVVPANHELLVSSTQPGLITELHVSLGDNVQKGQILAKIHSPELVSLQREFLTAGSELKLAEMEYQRDQKLFQEGVIAERRWQETRTLHSGKSIQYDSARQLLTMAGMSANEINALAESRQLSSLLNIRAPIGGVVLERLTTLGARLDIQAPIYRLADLSELWLEINIPQESAVNIHKGDLVKIENTPTTAKISLLGQSVNRDNQTVLARAIIQGKEEFLRAGQNVNVQILHNSEQSDFKVANSAISENDGQNYIYVRNADGFLVTKIKVIGRESTDSLIRAQLTGQERIAVKGVVALKANWLGLGASE